MNNNGAHLAIYAVSLLHGKARLEFKFIDVELLLSAGYDDYLDDDDLDLIEENLGVKVKRRVRTFVCLFVSPEIQ